ncbi:MAG: putative lipid II flippase FtsW [Nitrospira sp.]|nr:putative lipid II flippase FtsW [bacterium]MBL7048195.1 putative lipid II flippase FtsW [Nitrospira sp.]
MRLITRDTRSIVISILILVGIGTLMVFSSTAVLSARKYGNGFHYLWKHLFTVFIAASAMTALAKMDYRRLRPHINILMGAAVVMLLLVFMPGIGISANGARRWLRLWPMTFQPSEFVKLVMVVFMADYMTKNIHRMKSLKYGLLIPGAIMLGFQAIIIFQPDFGAVMSLGVITVGMLLIGGTSLKHMGGLLLLSLPAIYFLVFTSAYRLKRVMCFTDPWKDAYGCGFQLIQSFIAFGNGNWLGVGLGGSKQKLYFLPEVHTDFIFSLVGEELGLIGVLAVLSLFVGLFIKGVQLAKRITDPFSYFLALGLSIMIGVQAIINFAVATGLMPTKGLPLPFISYGGSALLINMAAAGILISISIHNEREKREQRVDYRHVQPRTAHAKRLK